MPCSPVPIPGPFLPVCFYSFLEIHKHFYSLSKPDDALGGRNASLVCNLSHAYHFYDCAPPPRLPSDAGPPCAAGTTHDSFSQMCAYGRWHIACVAYGLGLLPVPLVSCSTYQLPGFCMYVKDVQQKRLSAWCACPPPDIGISRAPGRHLPPRISHLACQRAPMRFPSP